jgi:hypothetical protein
MSEQPRTSDDDVIDWLLSGDVSIAYQTHRDLLDEERPDLRARIATEGWGAAFLAARSSPEGWGRAYYQPKWTSTHYTVADLIDLGLPPDHQDTRRIVLRTLDEQRGRDGGIDVSHTVGASDVCVSAMVIGFGCYFGAPVESLRGIVDFVLSQALPDGGFNCRSNRSGANHSSVYTTLSVMEAALAYERAGHGHRAQECADARHAGREFLLRHRLFRSERTGAVIHGEFTRLHHPVRWRYDTARALDHFRAAGDPFDERMAEAVHMLADRCRGDGRWVLNAHYPGATHFVMEPAGVPSRWATLKAMRVLRAYPAA